MSLDLFSSSQSLIGVEQAFRRIMLYCRGRTLCHGEVRYPKCVLVQAGLSQFCTFLGTILQDVWVISLSWPRLNIYTLVVTCVPLILQIFWMPVENSKSALSVLGSVLPLAITVFPTHKDNTLFGKLLFIHWANQRLKCKDFHHSLFYIYVAGRSWNWYILCYALVLTELVSFIIEACPTLDIGLNFARVQVTFHCHFLVPVD